MKTKWKDIEGHQGIYQISDSGLIRSMPRKGRAETKILKPSDNYWGYLTISLKGKAHRISRLVAQHFLGPIPFGKVVNHKDGNKKNNHISNLEYIDPSENHNHAIKNGLFINCGKNTNISWDKSVLKKYRKLKKTGLSSFDISKILGVHYRTILRWNHKNNYY